MLYIFINYISSFFEPIQDMAEQLSTLQNSFASAEKVFTVLDEVNPIIEKEETEELQVNKLLGALTPKGIVNSDPEVLSHLERRNEIDYPVIPVSFNKNGSVSKKSSVVTDEQLKVLSKYAKHKVEQIGKEILDGNIDVKPYQFGEQNPCTYCPYGGVCGFDENLPGFQYNDLKKLPNEELIRKMEEEV